MVPSEHLVLQGRNKECVPLGRRRIEENICGNITYIAFVLLTLQIPTDNSCYVGRGM